MALKMTQKPPSAEPKIFERYLHSDPFQAITVLPKEAKSCLHAHKTRSLSLVSMSPISSNCLCYNAEDFVAPVLDTAAEVLSNPDTDYNDVTLIYCGDHLEGLQEADRQSLSRRSRSRSVIRAELMKALDQSQEPSAEHTAVTPTTEAEGLTINFYSFAESLAKENELEGFNTRKMSELIS